MAYDMFEPRELTRVVRTMFPSEGFFKRKFFSSSIERHNTELIDFDVVKGSRRVAVYTRASAKSTPLAREKFTTGGFRIPYIKHNRSLEAVQKLLRQPGETIYDVMTPAQRAARQLAKDLKDLNEAIDRAEEVQAAQAIIDAKVIIKGNEIDAEIDFQRDAALSGDASRPWDAADPRIWDFFREVTALVWEKSGKMVSNAIFGKNALSAMVADGEVLELLDNQGVTIGNLNIGAPVVAPFPGARKFGEYGGIAFWEMYDGYDDPVTNTFTKFVPDDYVVFFCDGMETTAHYGPILDFGALIPLERFAKTYDENDPSVRTLLLQAAPAMINHTPNATAKFKVTNV